MKRITPAKVRRRLASAARECLDSMDAGLRQLLDRWPCRDRKYLMVGSESSGTTALSKLLFLEIDSIRFLEEGDQQWVWQAYRRIYRGEKRIEDYPRLQLFDAIKVPGFATIIPQFRAGFPNTQAIYIVRDPRDFVSSAIRTWKLERVEDLAGIPWVTEDWLGIPERDPVGRLALRWRAYVRAATSAGDVAFLKYEDFWVDKVATVRDLAERLELPFDAERVTRLRDLQLSHPSVRAYEPIGPGGWRDGPLREEHLRVIESRCAEEMERWGYAPI